MHRSGWKFYHRYFERCGTKYKTVFSNGIWETLKQTAESDHFAIEVHPENSEIAISQQRKNVEVSGLCQMKAFGMPNRLLVSDLTIAAVFRTFRGLSGELGNSDFSALGNSRKVALASNESS